jgi:hypothetical protein
MKECNHPEGTRDTCLTEDWPCSVHDPRAEAIEHFEKWGLTPSRVRERIEGEQQQLRTDNENLAMALRYFLRDHPDNCECYACTISNRYEVRNA